MTHTQKRWTASVVAASVALAALGLWPTTVSAYELRATFSQECPTTDYPKPEGRTESPELAIAIATSLATSLVDTGIAALKKAVNPGNATLEAQFLEQGLYMYKVVPSSGDSGAAPAPAGAASAPKATVKPAAKLGCLVVAAGTFSSAEGGVKGWTLPFASERTSEPAEETRNSAHWRVASALNLQGPATLALYLEAARVYSGDGTAVTWKPVRLYVGEYLNDSFWAGKSRSTSIEMRLYKPGKKEPFFSQDFPFAAVKKPVSMTSKELGDINAGVWGGLPAAPTLPADLKATADGRLFDPFTLEVRIVEAPKPYALAIAFADAVEKNKDAIKKEVTGALDPSAKAAAELTAEGVTLDAVNGFLTALKAATADCAADKVKDETGKLSCSISHDKADAARRKAELSCKTTSVPTCSSLPKVPAVPV